MDNKRQQKFARLIQKDLGEIFQRDVRSLFGSAFITVTSVRVSPDLGVAKVYLSFLQTDDKNTLLDSINSERKAIRKLLAERIRNQARIIPELIFFLDDNVEYASQMEQLFSKIIIPPLENPKQGPSKIDTENED